CVGCGICKHVCTGGAINISPSDDKTGYHYTVWYNSCCLCGSCRYYCPTNAISIVNNWHNSHFQEEKYKMAETHFIPYMHCEGCGAPMRVLPPHIAAKIYAHSPVDVNKIIKLCPSCRQIATAEQQGELHESKPE
ncbi:MAG TPA: hydrogenase, partial [Desulfovibrio sp.]|nr:hydrogenase [Desulfovibrio sp.]